MIGKQISHYRIVEKLGEGGMGVVYRADDTKLNRSVALKFLPAAAVENAEDRERLVAEAQSAAALDHPNICTVYEINEDNGQMYIAMAYVEGRSLRERIDESGPLGVLDAIKIGMQVAEGLRAAHEKGIVHRDIKSANIMVNERGQAKIMDFGLAHQTDIGAAGADSSTLGTVAYGSPEQARGDVVDHRGDIWSLGVTLFEALTGRLPFKGDYESAIVYSVLNEAPESLTTVRKDASPELEVIINKSLAKDVKDRYQSAEEMHAALKELFLHLDPHTTRARSATAAADTSWFQRLTQRHVLLSALIYIVAALAAAKGVDILVGRMKLSPYLVNTVALGLLSLVPSVMLIAYAFSGGRAARRPALIGVPLNLVLSATLLLVMFYDKDLGAATELIQVTDEDGNKVERTIPKGSFRKHIALYPFENRTGDPSADWVQYAVPMLVEYDIYQDSFIQTRSAFNRESYTRLQDAGFDSWINAPVSLKRKIAAEAQKEYAITGTIDRVDGEYQVTMQVHNTRTNRVVAEHTLSDPDLFSLIDEMTPLLKEDVGVPAWHLDGAPDANVADMVTNSVDAARELALAQVATQYRRDFPGAIVHLEAAVAADSTIAFAYSDLFSLYRLQNRAAEGQAAIEKALRLEYKLPERHRFIMKANYYFSQQKPDKAYAVLKMAVELYPDDTQGYAALAQIHQFRNEKVEAIAMYEHILLLDPHRSSLYQEIGRLQCELGKFDAAVESYEQYVRANAQSADAYTGLASVNSMIGNFSEARRNYEKAMMIDSQRIATRISVASLELKTGHLDESLAEYVQILAASKTSTDTVTVLAAMQEYYEMRGEYNVAIEYNRKRREISNRLVPELMRYMNHIDDLHLYVAANRIEEARAMIRDMEDNLQSPFDKAIAFAYLGYYLILEDPDGAEAALVGADEYLDMFNLVLYRPMYIGAQGMIHEQRGEYEEALAKHEEALSMAPDRFEAYLDLGRCYVEMGSYKRAEEYLLKYRRLFPFDPKNNYQLARVYQATGRQKKASASMERAMKVWAHADAEYRHAKEAREMLADWESASSM